MRTACLLSAVLSFPVLAQAPDGSSAVHSQVAASVHGKGHFVHAPQGRIYVEVEGTGPPVVIVAGGPGAGHASFHPWFSRLAEEHTVIYFDNIGRGRSDRRKPGAKYTVEADADDIESVRKSLRLPKISLIGHSYGGYPAMAYALKYPKTTDRLVLSDTLHNARAFQDNIDATNHNCRQQFPELWERLMALRRKGVKSNTAAYDDVYGGSMGDLYWYDVRNERQLFRAEDRQDGFNYAVYVEMLGNDPEWVVGGTLKGYDPSARMKTCRIPTLVCVGRYDRIASPRIAREIVSLLPDARLVVFEKSGHRPWIEEADSYFRSVSAFINGQPIPKS